MSISNPQIDSVSNYLVPAAGQTHAATLEGIFSATPQKIDWRQFSIDNFPFRPQGVFIDNSAGIAPLVISVQPINYNISCAAGAVGQFQFPAPDNQTCSIVGNGQATVVFVDFPVLPNAGQVNIAGTVNVNIASPNPLPVLPSQNAGGLAYQVMETPGTTTVYTANITTAGTVSTITPTPNLNLKRLKIAFSENCIIAVAGNVLLTVTLNGVLIYSEHIWLPGAAITTNIIGSDVELDCMNLGLNVGAAGTLVTTLGTALTGGFVDTNAYFGA